MPIVASRSRRGCRSENRDRRRSLVGSWALTVCDQLPAVWAVFQSPVVAQTSTATQVGALLQTVGMRLLVLAKVPVALVLLGGSPGPCCWTPVKATVVFVVPQVPMYMLFRHGPLGQPHLGPDAQVDVCRVR